MILAHSKARGRGTLSRNEPRAVLRIEETLPIMPKQQLLRDTHSQACSTRFALLDPLEEKYIKNTIYH